jgi:tripartite-type tricarboxylate transporter receptor subunit TctC
LGAVPAPAQNYPTRSITLIVPFAAGGPTDTVARIVGDHMSRTLHQTIVIENTLGAGGTTASTRAMRATPDGYTIIMGHMGTHAASVALYPNLAYKPDVDFEPIGMAAGTPILILAKKDFPPKDLKEFITYQFDHAESGPCRRGLGVPRHRVAARPSAGRQADAHPVPGHGARDECADRRSGRLHDRPDR